MPIEPTAQIEITGFGQIPDFARGHVRDLRARWALEEMGRSYRTRLFSAYEPRPDDYLDWQPFAQVPALADDDLKLFESGAILLYLGEQDERLLPRDPRGRWAVTSWLFAALNSVEPMVMSLVWIDQFNAGKDWAKEAHVPALEMLNQRLGRVADALGDQDWLAGHFSVADIMMITVLRNLDDTVLGAFPRLAAYRKRGEARPAFQRAITDQAADHDAALAAA